MDLIFLDECGYVKNWSEDKAIDEQPFYVLAAVAIDATRVQGVYEQIRQEIKKLSLPGVQADRLGRGEEIKARQVDRGDDPFKNPEHRNLVRSIYLGQDAIYFVACIRKRDHKKRYPNAQDPSQLALRFIFERVQPFLKERGVSGLVLVDKNKRDERQQQEYSAGLLTGGSTGFAYNQFYDTFYEWKIDFENIIEIHFGDSRYSLGLQIADFVARHVYSWRKEGQPPDYPGWNIIKQRLYRRRGRYKGWGYKEFPP